MGYCYDAQTGQLCCDICGNHGGVRRVRCPFGYCQATAACPDCRKKHKAEFRKEKHRERGCEAAHNRCVAEDKERAQILEDGGYVLVAGRSVDDVTVHAIFRGKDGYIARYVPEPVYDHWSKRANPTLAWFEELAGSLLPVAPLDFHTKQVSVVFYNEADGGRQFNGTGRQFS